MEHGTGVASVAAGKVHGVASRAEIVLVKLCQVFYEPTYHRWRWADTTRATITEIFRMVIEHVLRKRAGGYTGKSIVNISAGMSIKRNQDESRAATKLY